jgi:hypothetical protein
MKNSIKKTLLPFIFLWAFIPCGIGKNENPEKKSSTFQPFYNIEANLGISTNRKMTNPYERAKLSYRTLVYGVNFAGGFTLAHYAKAGFGIGFLFYSYEERTLSPPHFLVSSVTFGIPLFLYLRSDFSDHKNSPYLDIKIGNNFLITKEPLLNPSPPEDDSPGVIAEIRIKNGLFLSTNLGIAFKDNNNKVTTNLSIGYRLVSRAYDVPYAFFYDKTKYSKTGFTIMDHQFVINLGITLNKIER